MRPFRRRWAFFEVFASSRFLMLALVLGLVALFALMPRTWSALTTLRIAVTDPSDDLDVMVAMRDLLRQSEHSLRLKLMGTPNETVAAKDLDSGAADLAIVRADSLLPKTGETVLVFHRDSVLGIAVPKRKIKDWHDLAHKHLAIFPASPQNIALTDDILAKFGIPDMQVDHVNVKLEDLARAMRDKKVDAVVAIAPLSSPLIAQVLEAVRSADKAPPILLDVAQAEGLSARYPKFEKIEIPEGYFQTDPVLPKKDISILGISYLLQARVSLDETVVTNLTKLLFSLRPQVAAHLPLAGLLEKPVEEKTSVRALHLGAAAYYGDTEKTFMDRYGDWFYISAMAFSGIISALAGLFGMAHAKARRKALYLIDQLIATKDDAHRAERIDELDDISARIEHLSTLGLQHARDNNFDEAGISALRLAIDEARRAVTDQRNELVTLRVRAPMTLLAAAQAAEGAVKA